MFKEIPNRIKFFIIILAVFLALALLNPSYAQAAWLDFLETFLKIAPIFILVYVLIFFANLFVKPDAVRKHLGQDSGRRGWLYSALASAVFAGPPYIIIPFLGDLKKHGMKSSLISVFLNIRSVQPAFLPVMAHYFGLTFTVIITVLTFLFTYLNGLVIEKALAKEL